MVPAQWDSRPRNLPRGEASAGGTPRPPCRFKASGRTLVFDGFYKVMGVPPPDEDPARAREATRRRPDRHRPDAALHHPAPLHRGLAAEETRRRGHRPAVDLRLDHPVIQDRKYVEPSGAATAGHATDLGKVVTDKLLEAFPEIMDVGYTRKMEPSSTASRRTHQGLGEDARRVLRTPSARSWKAHESMTHAKAETEPAPYDCPTCGAPTCYRFGKTAGSSPAPATPTASTPPRSTAGPSQDA